MGSSEPRGLRDTDVTNSIAHEQATRDRNLDVEVLQLKGASSFAHCAGTRQRDEMTCPIEIGWQRSELNSNPCLASFKYLFSYLHILSPLWTWYRVAVQNSQSIRPGL